MLEQITKQDSWIYESLQYNFLNFFQSEENRRRSCIQSVAGQHVMFFPPHLLYHPLISKHSHHWKIKWRCHNSENLKGFSMWYFCPHALTFDLSLGVLDLFLMTLQRV